MLELDLLIHITEFKICSKDAKKIVSLLAFVFFLIEIAEDDVNWNILIFQA